MKTTIVFIALLIIVTGYAQNRLDDMERICIHAVVPESETLPTESAKLLESKLSQIITSNGIADNEYGVRFVLTAKVNIISKDIVVGPPQRISQKLDITFMLGDIVEDKVYSQMNISTIGIGQSAEKAYIAAFRNINPNSEKNKTFVKEGKAKVLDYYQTHCEDVIDNACQKALQQNYEEALLMLASVPDICTDCLNDATVLAKSVYEQMIDARGSEFLNEAKNVWARSPTKEGAYEATNILSQINFAATCWPEAESLLNEITTKMNEIDRREWQHQMDVYRDNMEREKRDWQQHVREYDERVKTQRMYLNACRDVAITYARNQPKTINRIVYYNRVILW